MKKVSLRILAVFLSSTLIVGCGTIPRPYVGVNPKNPQFERGRICPPLDWFGCCISFPLQLIFWNFRFGNHRVTAETEQALMAFIDRYQLTDVKVRINQWAPHKEFMRCFKNTNIAWPYRILFSPGTFITALIARPFSGLIISDYYDPGSHSINIFSNDIAIALHEAGHTKDFKSRRWKGTYAVLRYIPGIDLGQEYIASDNAIYYLEQTKQYNEQLRAYRILIPAYMTYVGSYLGGTYLVSITGVIAGHIIGLSKRAHKKRELIQLGKMTVDGVPIDRAISPSAASRYAITQPNPLRVNEKGIENTID